VNGESAHEASQIHGMGKALSQTWADTCSGIKTVPYNVRPTNKEGFA